MSFAQTPWVAAQSGSNDLQEPAASESNSLESDSATTEREDAGGAQTDLDHGADDGLSAESTASADDEEDEGTVGVEQGNTSQSSSKTAPSTVTPAAPPGELLGYDTPRLARWRLGFVLESGSSTCTGVIATLPIPREWPEQTVRLVAEQLDPYVTAWDFRELEGGVRQIVLKMSSVPPGTEASAIWEFEIERSRILPPADVSSLRIPKKIGRDLKAFMGISPYIETNDAKIRKVARDLKAVEPEEDWKKVEQIYDWVRDNVEYREGPIRSAKAALKDKWGDCEDMTSLFVALCRNRGIPARMVWIPGHCYPEFYLEDDSGKGAWFPCQVAGTRQFGTMDEARPVLQKGDRFNVPEKEQPQRYVAEHMKVAAVRGSGKPTPRFIRELVNPTNAAPATTDGAAQVDR
jgi:hypothetical protein